MATAGDLPQWHPHLHLIATDAGRGRDGSWSALSEWDSLRLMTLFRERLLARLVESRAISKERVAKLLAWRHPRFSAHVGERITPEDKQRLLDTAAYLVRNPLSLKKLPFLGRNFEALDPLRLARPHGRPYRATPDSTARCSTASTRTASGVSLTLPRPKSARWPSSRHASAARRVGHA